MGIFNGPRIITEGLVLNYDVGNVNSYVGSGSSLLDLSNSKINTTLNNSVTYSSNNKGYLIFNGTNQYSNINNNSNFDMSTGDFTIDLWVYPTSFTNITTIFGQGTATNGISIGIQKNGSPYVSFGNLYGSVSEGNALYLTPPTSTVFTSILYAGYGVNGGTGPNYTPTTISSTSRSVCETAYIGKSNQVGMTASNGIFGDPIPGTVKTFAITVTYGIISSQTISLNTWNNITVTRIGTTLYLYLNTVLVNQVTYLTTLGTSTINNYIGTNVVASTNYLYYTGGFSNIKIYKSRGLLSSEVLKNYNVYKKRYI